MTAIKPPPLPVTARPRRVKSFVNSAIFAIIFIALGMATERWLVMKTGEFAYSSDLTSKLPQRDEARQLPTAQETTGVPMIKSAEGGLVSLRPISIREFQSFAKQAGLADSSYAWVHYNWGWEWKKGYSWRYSGETRSPGDMVTAISLQDAQAFCRWLTDKQRAQGLLAPGQFYRVPESDQTALLAAQAPHQPSIREKGENLAPGFHIELAETGI